MNTLDVEEERSFEYKERIDGITVEALQTKTLRWETIVKHPHLYTPTVSKVDVAKEECKEDIRDTQSHG